MGCTTHRAETASLCKSTADLNTVVALIQQPCINNKILGLVLLVLHYTGVGTLDVGPHACILICEA